MSETKWVVLGAGDEAVMIWGDWEFLFISGADEIEQLDGYELGQDVDGDIGRWLPVNHSLVVADYPQVFPGGYTGPMARLGWFRRPAMAVELEEMAAAEKAEKEDRDSIANQSKFFFGDRWSSGYRR